MAKCIPLFIAKGLAPLLKKMPTLILRIRYWKRFRQKLNLKNPELFCDKVFYLSLYSDTSQWSILSDKYDVRAYVEEKCDHQILNKLYGVYKSPKDILYDSLPDSYVLKTTNGCECNIFVKQRDMLDIKKTNQKLSKWLRFPYGELTGQLHYTKIEPQIIAEKLLKQDEKNSSLIDYKIYCFDGVPTYIWVLSNRKPNTHIFYQMMYDVEWNAHPEFFISDKMLKEVPRPISLDKMVESAKALSQPFPFVRIDLYEIEGNPIFGEMTFTPGVPSRTVGWYTVEFQKELGRLIKLPQKNKSISR